MKTKAFPIVVFGIVGLLFTACEEPLEESMYPTACFSKSYEGEQIWETYVAFTNCSEDATSYFWDFGDDSTSMEENPIHQYMNDGLFIVSLTVLNDAGEDNATDTVLVNWTQVDKPNIYLYPTETIDLCVILEFPMGGEIVASIPTYFKEWCVSIDTSGKIDHTYEYLFYESIQPDVWQYEKGWCVKKEDLEDFFTTNMRVYNFNDKEIKDFVDHWIHLLIEDEYYNIYPQYNSQIEQVIQINFSIQPDNLYRLFYGVIGTDQYTEISEPEIEKADRKGFTVVEWGVFRK